MAFPSEFVANGYLAIVSLKTVCRIEIVQPLTPLPDTFGTPVPPQLRPLPDWEVASRRSLCSLRSHSQNAMTRCITQNTATLPMA